MTFSDRQMTDWVWDLMAELGYVDARGGVQYQSTFPDTARQREFAEAGKTLLARARGEIE